MLDFYLMGRDSWGKASFPDGRAPLDQPVKLTGAFNVIRHTLKRYEKR